MDPASDSSLTSTLVKVGVNELTSTFVYCHTDIIFHNYTVTICWLCVFNAWKYPCSFNLDGFMQRFAFLHNDTFSIVLIMNFKSIQTMVFKSRSAFYTFGFRLITRWKAITCKTVLSSKTFPTKTIDLDMTSKNWEN